MLERHCTWNLSYFDHRQGEGRQWAAHLLWLQSSFLSITDRTPPNIHRPFFLLQTNQRVTLIWLSRPQATSLPLLMPAYVTTHWSTASRPDCEERERKTYGLEEWTQSRICYTHAWKRDSPTIFSGLCTQSRASILLPTLLGPHYTCCWCHWYDSKTIVAQNAAGPSHGSLVWRNVPWLQKTYKMEKTAQPTFCWTATTIHHLLQAEKKTI